MDGKITKAGKTIGVENFKKELCFIFFSQKKTIFIVTLIIFLFAIFIAFFWPPTYSSSGTILLKGKKVAKSPEALEETELRYFKLTKEDLFSEEQVLLSRQVINNTIEYLYDNKLIDLNKDGEKISISDIKSSLNTEILPSSNIIKITNNNKNPDFAAIILNALMEQYLTYRIKMNSPEKVASFFDRQVERFKQGLMEKERELLTIVKENKMSDPLMEVESNLLIKKDLEFDLNVLKNEVIDINSHIEQLDGTFNNDSTIQFYSFINDSVIISNFGAKLQELVIERLNKLRIYHPSSEAVKMIEDHINETHQSLRAEVMAYKENLLLKLNNINNKMKSIENRINILNIRNVTLKKLHIDTNRISRENNLLQASYETFFRRREEALINSNTVDINIMSTASILDEATSSDKPAFPNKNAVIPLGIIVGFITGCSLGFLKDYFDNTFKKPDSVYAFTELPVIFSIPEYKRF